MNKKKQTSKFNLLSRKFNQLSRKYNLLSSNYQTQYASSPKKKMFSDEAYLSVLQAPFQHDYWLFSCPFQEGKMRVGYH